jgi:uncharacterized protein
VSLSYNVATLLKEPVGATRDYDVESDLLVDGACREHLAGHARLLRTKQGVLVSADLGAVEHDECSRCLIAVDVPVRVAFQEEFFASVDLLTGTALPPPDDPEAFRIDARHTLDLTEAVRQYWAGALPMQPLCRPDCRGLCPRCGQDLNRGPCACPPEEDERWTPLRQLAHELEGK